MSELAKQLADSEPTTIRVFKGTAAKLQTLAKSDKRSLPYYLAVLADREYDKLRDNNEQEGLSSQEGTDVRHDH